MKTGRNRSWGDLGRHVRRRAWRRLFPAASLIAILGASAACNTKPPLAPTRSSPTDLARAVLDALQRRDRPSLAALAISEQEFRDHVWPELPAARPERNLPFSYVWMDLRQKSDSGLARALAEQGGHHYDLLTTRFSGETTQYGSFLVHRKSELTVKDSSGERKIQVFGSVLEKGGRFKVFSYIVD